jgi:putative hydrolase of the HAD superfamily
MPFLNSVGKKYPICVSSDTDEDMLGPLRQLYHFDRIFTSEQFESYKTGNDGKFFLELVKHYNVNPGSIIHIGDSSSDVIGASEAGILTCWLNREHKKRTYDIRPDYEVNSLIEAAMLLGVDIDSK